MKNFNMKTGFYDLSVLNDKQLKTFFEDALLLSYDAHIDVLDANKSWSRQRCTTKTIGEMIENASSSYHNICIDRSIQHDIEKYGEIGYCTLGSPDYFLYIFTTLENLQELIEKYNVQENH